MAGADPIGGELKMIRSFVVTASLAASLLATTVLAQTESVSFELTNNTGFTLTRIYLSLPSSNSWEEDILGDEVVESGETVVVSVDDGLEACEYDIRYDFSDGDSLIEKAVDMCEIDGSEYSIG